MMKWVMRITVLALLFVVLFLAPARTSADAWTILGYHTVRTGETLFCIGRAYGVDPWAIASQNNIIDVNHIDIGLVLAIPDAPAVIPAGPVCGRQFEAYPPPPPPPPTCGNCTCRFNHLVVSGNTLSHISLAYNVDMWSIAECNCITNLDYIRIGETLCIP